MPLLLLALLALSPIQDPSPAAIREWISQLSDESPDRRNEACKKLKDLRQAAVPALRKAAADGDSETRGQAARLLSVIAVMDRLPASLLKAVPGIEDRLSPDGGETWTEAFLNLSSVNPETLKGVDLGPLAMEAAKNARSHPQGAAVVAAAQKLHHPSVAPALLLIAKSGHEDNRRQAVRALIQLEARAELLEVARPRNEMPRQKGKEETEKDFEAQENYLAAINLGYEAFGALCQLGAKTELLAMIRGGIDRGYPGDAATALADLGATEAIPDLVKLLPLLEHFELAKVARALGDLGAASAAPDLAKLLANPLGLPRAGAMEALSKIGDRTQIPAMIDHLKDKRSAVKVAASQALGRLKAAEARKPMIDAVEDDDATMRAVTALALAEIPGDGILEALTARLEDRELVVRVHAAAALVRKGSRKGLPTLIRYAANPVGCSMNIQAEGFGGGVIMEIRPSMEPNALRTPGPWKAFLERRLTKNAVGVIGADLEQFARDGGLALSLSPELAAAGKAFLERQYYFAPLQQGWTIRRLLEQRGNGIANSFRIDDGTLIVSTEAEAVRFWMSWFVDDVKARPGSPAEAADAAAFAEELRRSAMTPEARKALEEREADRAKAAHRKERQQELGELLTPGLRALLGFEDALLNGDDHTWTTLLLAQKPGETRLKGAELDLVAVQGLRAAVTPEERKKAADAVAGLRAKGALEAILALLGDPDMSVRIAAVGAIGVIGGVPEVPRVAEVGKDPNPWIRMAASKALFGMESPEAMPIFAELTRQEPYELRDPAAMYLSFRGGPEYIPDMIPLLKHATGLSNCADSAIRFLSRHGAREAIPQLIGVVQAERSHCVQTAQQALVVLGAKEAALPVFLRLFEAGDSSVAWELALWGADQTRPEMRRRLALRDEHWKPGLIRALAHFGDRESIPLLEKLLVDQTAFLQGDAARALARLQGAKAAPKLLAAPDPNGSMDEALAGVGAREAVPAMIGRLDQYCRDVTITALMDLGAREALPKIFESMKTPDNSYNYYNALKAVARVFPKESVPTMRIYLERCTSSNRDLAAGFLCATGSREAVPLLLEGLQPAPLALNALRNPAAWERLAKRTMGGSRYRSGRDLAMEIASEAGLEFVDLPAGQPALGAWMNRLTYYDRPFRAPTLLEWLEYLQGPDWGIVLEGLQLKILPRTAAAELWRTWWAAEKDRK